MKRLIPIVLAVVVLAAVPAAFADNGVDYSTAPAPSATAPQQGDLGPEAGLRRLGERLTRLDTRLQQRIAKLKERCGATSTEPRCANIARLQKVDDVVRALLQTLRDRLG